MSTKGIISIVAGIIGVTLLIVGLVLMIVVEPKLKPLDPDGIQFHWMAVGLVFLMFNGVFIGFPLRFGYERAIAKWKTGGIWICASLTALGGCFAMFATVFLILEEGPSENLALPVWQLILFGLGMALVPGGLQLAGWKQHR